MKWTDEMSRDFSIFLGNKELLNIDRGYENNQSLYNFAIKHKNEEFHIFCLKLRNFCNNIGIYDSGVAAKILHFEGNAFLRVDDLRFYLD